MVAMAVLALVLALVLVLALAPPLPFGLSAAATVRCLNQTCHRGADELGLLSLACSPLASLCTELDIRMIVSLGACTCT